MHRAINQFDDSIKRIRNIDAVYIHLTSTLNLNPLDIEDILRSEIVYAVSALDKLVHELVRLGMIEIFKGTRSATDSYLKFNIPLEQYSNIVSPTYHLPAEIVFEQCVLTAHGHLAFQDPEKINIALNLISPVAFKWQNIGVLLTMPENDVKVKLKNIVIRRNQIVHESDIDLSTGLLQSISHTDTVDSVQFINDLGKAIYDLVK